MKIESLQRDRLRTILFQDEFFEVKFCLIPKKFLGEIFEEQWNDITFIGKCREKIQKIEEDIHKFNATEDYEILCNLNNLQDQEVVSDR